MEKTLTVGELRKRLEDFPDDLPVYLTWEGTFHEIEDRLVTIETSAGRFDDTPVFAFVSISADGVPL